MEAVSFDLASKSSNAHTLVRYEHYGVGTLKHVVQPFSVRINPTAAFLCDFHAHLATSEVIGLLGGKYDRDKK